MVSESQNIGFALLPQAQSFEELKVYINGLMSSFPKAKILIFLASHEQLDIVEYVDHASIDRVKQNLVARAYVLLEAARTMELSHLVFNTGMQRYNLSATQAFVKRCGDFFSTDIIFGEPPIVNPNNNVYSPENLSALEIPRVRHRLIIDMLINIMISYSGSKFTYKNVNAGLFCLRTTKDLLRLLGAVSHYEPSSLVCSQFAWHLMRSANPTFTVNSVPVDSINLHDLKFDIDKAVREIAFIFHMVSNRFSGNSVQLGQAAVHLFDNKKEYNRWVTGVDKDWFFDILIPKLKKSGCLI